MRMFTSTKLNMNQLLSTSNFRSTIVESNSFDAQTIVNEICCLYARILINRVVFWQIVFSSVVSIETNVNTIVFFLFEMFMRWQSKKMMMFAWYNYIENENEKSFEKFWDLRKSIVCDIIQKWEKRRKRIQ